MLSTILLEHKKYARVSSLILLFHNLYWFKDKDIHWRMDNWSWWNNDKGHGGLFWRKLEATCDNMSFKKVYHNPQYFYEWTKIMDWVSMRFQTKRFPIILNPDWSQSSIFPINLIHNTSKQANQHLHLNRHSALFKRLWAWISIEYNGVYGMRRVLWGPWNKM